MRDKTLLNPIRDTGTQGRSPVVRDSDQRQPPISVGPDINDTSSFTGLMSCNDAHSRYLLVERAIDRSKYLISRTTTNMTADLETSTPSCFVVHTFKPRK